MNASDMQLRQLVGELTENTPSPRPWSSIEARSAADLGTVAGRRRLVPLAAAAALIVAAIVALAVWGSDRHQGTIVPSTGAPVSTGKPVDETPTNASVIGPETSVLSDETTSIASTTTAASSEPSATTSLAPLLPNDGTADGQLQAVATAALRAQSSVDSVRATVTVHTQTTTADGTVTDQTDETNVMTLMSDGRMWTEGDHLLWASYDPTTGVAQTATQKENGTDYARITQADSPQFAAPFLGDILQLDNGVGPGGTATVTEVMNDGRSAWQIHEELPPLRGVTTVGDRIIDRQTGLTTSSHNTTIESGVTTERDVRVTHLETGVGLPASYPGLLPPDAAESAAASGYGTGPLSLADAVAKFGSTIWIPAVRPEHTTVWVYSANNPGFVNVSLRIEMPVGLARQEVSIHKFVSPTDGSALPPTQPPVAPPCTDTCAVASTVAPDTSGLPSLTGGAFAGVPYPISSDGSIDVEQDNVQITVRGLDAADSLKIANSLIPVDADGRPQYDPHHTPVSDAEGHHVGWIDTIGQDDRIEVPLPDSYTAADPLNPVAVGVTIVRNDDGEPIGLMTGIGFIAGGLINDGTDIDPAIKQQIIDDAIANTKVVHGPIPTDAPPPS